MMLPHLLSAVAALTALSLSTQYLEESFKRGGAPRTPAPTQLALEIGRLGDDNLPQQQRRRLGGDSDRVFGPVRPSSRLGTYTGNGLGSYTGRGLGTYTGGGMGAGSDFGTGNSAGSRADDERFR